MPLDPLTLLTGIVLGAIPAWALARARTRTTEAELRATLEAERRFAEERREQAQRADALLGQLATLGDSHRDLSARTQHLVDALRSPVVRGEWGEMQLRRVCELARMAEHIDFEVQRIVPGEGQLRPDMVVHLPGGRSIVIDAKTPMAAWLDAMEALDDTERTDALRVHARQVRDQVARLGAKQYWAQFSVAPRFVVLFLPGEALFAAALQYDATLVEYGIARGVVLASPTTLLALLRAVGDGWERTQAVEQAEEIAALGGELHERLGGFATQLGDVRRGLERAVEAYNKAAGNFEQRVGPSARRLGSLAAAAEEPLPPLTPVNAGLRGETPSA